MEKESEGRHLDTPSEIILQASLRMHFEGGQGSFFNAGQRHRETTRLLALLLFSHPGSLRGKKGSPLMPLPRGLGAHTMRPLTKRKDAAFRIIQQRNYLPDRSKPDKLEG